MLIVETGMEKVPQIVRGRLHAASVPVEHPDADVLTAFSERSLLKAEQSVVLEHLARCSECREIVALALPVSEPLQQVVHPSRNGWLTWPVLRWGIIAAGITAITSFGVVQYQRQHSQPAIMGYKASAESDLAKDAKNVPPTTAVPEAGVADKKPQPTQSKTRAEQSTLDKSQSRPSDLVTLPPTRESGTRAGVVVKNLQRGPRVQWQQNANNAQYQAPSAPPSSLQFSTSQVASNAPTASRVEESPTTPDSGTQTARVDSSDASQDIEQRSETSNSLKVEKSKPAITTAKQAPVPGLPDSGATIHGAVNGRDLSRMVTVSAASLVVWNISPSGALQRSFDQGGTWNDVDVSGSFNLTYDATSPGGTSRAKETKADTLKKKDVSAPVFRAVASNGADVWAGATMGLLYHSTDAGSHWIRVVPSASGATLTGEIVSLEFIDPQHGRIVTSSPEVWTTSDAGQTWQKQ